MARRMGLKGKSPTWRWGVYALEKRNGPVLEAGLRGVHWLGRELGRCLEDRGGSALGSTCESRCQKLCSLGSEPSGPCEEPKRPEKPSEKQPTGVPPGTLPDCMAHPLPVSLHVEQPGSAGPWSCRSSCRSQTKFHHCPHVHLYHEIVSITGPKTGIFFLEAKELEVR